MRLLPTVAVLALTLSGASAVPQAQHVNTVAAREPIDLVADAVSDVEKRGAGLVKRPNGPAPPSTGDPTLPPDAKLWKRPNGPAPPSTGDPTLPPGAKLWKRPNGPAPPSTGDPYVPPAGKLERRVRGPSNPSKGDPSIGDPPAERRL
ncbi:hypothetical protein Cob_v007104 [Colletotrichum orbiculare MAFF 240422]|uniref:Uncharacterized protein n=1 Tax=Colletotrichum orbiculare (strain 104-T / ATCC 96160 / CBS 514.97 / LARS 414 / MAFF 240422) TaxID=1213857 RepID=N4V5C3_COLOR|nr:hypothetical protein Cob_v007104 [Colletotrichum orbiculare MAFF 240422]